MGLRSVVEKIYLDNKNYSYTSQAVNQASSLNALSADLYTDSKRLYMNFSKMQTTHLLIIEVLKNG